MTPALPCPQGPQSGGWLAGRRARLWRATAPAVTHAAMAGRSTHTTCLALPQCLSIGRPAPVCHAMLCGRVRAGDAFQVRLTNGLHPSRGTEEEQEGEENLNKLRQASPEGGANTTLPWPSCSDAMPADPVASVPAPPAAPCLPAAGCRRPPICTCTASGATLGLGSRQACGSMPMGVALPFGFRAAAQGCPWAAAEVLITPQFTAPCSTCSCHATGCAARPSHSRVRSSLQRRRQHFRATGPRCTGGSVRQGFCQSQCMHAWRAGPLLSRALHSPLTLHGSCTVHGAEKVCTCACTPLLHL